MKIAVFGTGYVGRALGLRLAKAGHSVVFGSRDPSCEKCQQLAAEGATVSDWQGAARDAEILLLAVPWQAARETLAACGDLSQRVVIDCINPVKPDMSGLDLGDSPSAAESIAAWAPEAQVVKAFNALSAASMEDPQYGELAATMFYCGDQQPAKDKVAQLAEDLGLEPVDAGPLANAAYLESLAMLYIHLAMNGWGGHCAFKMLKR